MTAFLYQSAPCSGAKPPPTDYPFKTIYFFKRIVEFAVGIGLPDKMLSDFLAISTQIHQSPTELN
jgi:hypothetical protein